MSIANDNGEPAWSEELASLVLVEDGGNGNEVPDPDAPVDE